ncbi:MAG: hypothetical protein WC735_04545 [Candidatus Paceibacterota bacterium]|jgi:hypothetical protein
MQSEKSKVSQKEILTPFLEEVLKDALKKYADTEAQMQLILEQNKPFLEQVAKIAEQAKEAFSNSQPKEELKMLVHSDLYIPRTAHPALTEEDKEDIAESLAIKLLKAKGTKHSVHFSEPIIILPQGARWEDVEISFIDAHSITVRCKHNHVGKYDFEELRFSKRKSEKEEIPGGVLWKLLLELSMLSGVKGARPTKHAILEAEKWIKENTLEKRRSNLATKLQGIFPIKDDPFLPYDQIEGYRTKFILKPPAILRGDGELHRSGIPFKDSLYDDEDDEDQNLLKNPR